MFKYGHKNTRCVECAAACSLVDIVLLSLFLLVTFKRQPQTNYLSVYDHFVGLALKALKIFSTNFAFNPVYYFLSKTSNNGYLSIKVTPNQQSLSSNTLKPKSYETNSNQRPVKFGHYEWLSLGIALYVETYIFSAGQICETCSKLIIKTVEQENDFSFYSQYF